MRVYERSEDADEASHGCVLTIGNFDGLHLGHEALLSAVVERGRELRAPTGVYTFEPHPRKVLSPEVEVPRLMTFGQLRLALERARVDFLVREPFTLEFSSLSAEAFLSRVICDRIAPREIFVGRDFHFGKGATGSGDTLTSIGPTLGIRVTVIPQVRSGERDVSSTRVRELLREGEVAEAALCMGRPYAIWGSVVVGDKRGRTLGFPTANLEPENELIPQNGVYASTVRLFRGDVPDDEPHPAVTNVGTRPTFPAGRVLVETHLLDFEGDLYGRRLELAFHCHIRDERRFSGPEELAEQIGRDAERARELLAAAHS